MSRNGCGRFRWLPTANLMLQSLCGVSLQYFRKCSFESVFPPRPFAIIRRNDGSNVASLLPPLKCPAPCPYVNPFVTFVAPPVKRRFRETCQQDESPVFGFSMQPFTLSITIQVPLHGQHRRALCFDKAITVYGRPLLTCALPLILVWSLLIELRAWP
jgi:hypothetical protein